MNAARGRRAGLGALWLAFALPAAAWADTAATEDWNAKFQTTYIWQGKRPLAAAYSGRNSLRVDEESSYSFTATAALGWRLGPDTELYFNPEAAQGVPLSQLTGLGGFTNGDIARSSGPTLKVYRARLFVRQTWNQGGEREALASEANQLARSVDSRRWVLTAGNLSVIDLFDRNAYSHDPRTQFMNWSLMTHGAYDFAADARGYSWGAALERHHDEWVFRAGRFIQPYLPNQQALNPRVFNYFGDQFEIERSHRWWGEPGKLRMLVFRNRARMAGYQDAIDLAARTGGPPSLDAVRTADRSKRGVGLSLEQALSPDVGVFARASRADGQTETYAFTEIDRSVSGGVLVKGSAWRRAQDTAGIGWARNHLSAVHRDYLARGGLGFFIGDGQLRYRPEQVLEVFYSLHLDKGVWVTLDGQRIRHPAYNADRGPVRVMAVRLHTEF